VPRPLAGMRIIDLTHMLAGPFATYVSKPGRPSSLISPPNVPRFWPCLRYSVALPIPMYPPLRRAVIRASKWPPRSALCFRPVPLEDRMKPNLLDTELSIGKTFEGSMTVTETHIVMGAGRIGGFQAAHIDQQYAKLSFRAGLLSSKVFAAIRTRLRSLNRRLPYW
jgi:hypothetical protein